LRASRTLDTSEALFCGKVAPFNGVVPRGIAPVIMLHNLGRVLDDLAAKKTVVLVKCTRTNLRESNNQ
jgi:hypothetical protein